MDAGIAGSGAVLVLLFGGRVRAMLDPACSSPPVQSLMGETQLHAWPDPANLH